MESGRRPQDDRRTAIIVGVLFVVATVLYLVGGAIYGPSTGSSVYLERAYPDRTTIMLGVLLEFLCVLAIPLIGMFLFPVLRRWHEGLALAYAGFRSIEAVFLIVIEAKLLSLVDLSREYRTGTGEGETAWEAVGTGVLAEIDRLFTLYVFVFAAGALILYGLLYRSGLVPRWLSAWGFAAAAWMMAGTVGVILTSSPGALLEALIVLPIAVNEMVLAVLLIAKGFDATPGPRGMGSPADRTDDEHLDVRPRSR